MIIKSNISQPAPYPHLICHLHILAIGNHIHYTIFKSCQHLDPFLINNCFQQNGKQHCRTLLQGSFDKKYVARNHAPATDTVLYIQNDLGSNWKPGNVNAAQSGTQCSYATTKILNGQGHGGHPNTWYAREQDRKCFIQIDNKEYSRGEGGK